MLLHNVLSVTNYRTVSLWLVIMSVTLHKCDEYSINCPNYFFRYCHENFLRDATGNRISKRQAAALYAQEMRDDTLRNYLTILERFSFDDWVAWALCEQIDIIRLFDQCCDMSIDVSQVT